ncbi:MAG: hypothetical protein ACFBZ8_04590 [Opitutales bacterium]
MKKNIKDSKPSAPRSQSGFALIVAMTLMGFLVLLLVGISTLVRTETQAATSENFQNLARQYARMGLNIAIGELQRTAGLDTRVTATADILTVDGVTVENPHWTGVWPVDPQVSGAGFIDYEVRPWEAAYDPHPVFGKGGSNPKGKAHWLVSGNENKDVRLDTDYITPLDSLLPEESVILFNHPSKRFADTLDARDRIRAPLQDIVLDNPRSSDVILGRYAWAVIDEQVKARVSIADPVELAELEGKTVNPADRRNQKTLQSPGLEFVTSVIDDSRTYSDLFGVDLDPRLLEGLLIPDQITLLAPDSPAALATLQAELLRSSHGLTTVGSGLLVDVRNGGLKKDLSLAFEMTDDEFEADTFFSPSQADPDGLYTDDGKRDLPRLNGLRYAGGSEPWRESAFHKPIYEVEAEFSRDSNKDSPESPKFYGPTWQLMRDFYRLYKPNESNYNIPGIQDPLGSDPTVRARGFWVRSADSRDRAQASSNFDSSLYRFNRHNYRVSYYHAGRNNPGGSESTSKWRLQTHPTVAPILPVMTNLAYRVGMAHSEEDPSQDTDLNPPPPPSNNLPIRLLMTVEPFITLWNPYNVSLEFDALKLTLRPASGLETVVEVPLHSWDANRFYKFEEEVRYRKVEANPDGSSTIGPEKVYRLVNANPNLRRGIKPSIGKISVEVPSPGGGTVTKEVFGYEFEAGYSPTPQEIQALANANPSDVGQPLEAIWIELIGDGNDPLLAADREEDGIFWTVGAATPMNTIYGEAEQEFIVVSQAAADTLGSLSDSIGAPTPIVLEPGEIRVFGPANSTLTENGQISGSGSNAERAFLLSEAYQPDGGAYFEHLRSRLDNSTSNKNTLQTRVNRFRDWLANNLDNSIQLEMPNNFAAGEQAKTVFDGGYSRLLEVDRGDVIRVTMGAWGMKGSQHAVDEQSTHKQFYPHIDWGSDGPFGDGRHVGNDGRSFNTWLGEFNRSGPWNNWGTNNNTFHQSDIRVGFGVKWNHRTPEAYGNPDGNPDNSIPDLAIVHQNLQADADLPNIFEETPPKYAMINVFTHLRTPEDEYQVRPIAVNNVRYVADVDSDGQIGFGGTDANNMVTYAEKAPGLTNEEPVQTNGGQGFWGESVTANGQNYITLFDLPLSPMTSIADFQHAHIEWTFNAPTYVVGTSEALPDVRRGSYGDNIETSGRDVATEDVSYLSNQALFDSYYFSTLAPRVEDGDNMDLEEVIDAFVDGEGSYRLPNGRMRFVSNGDDPAEIKDTLKDIVGAYDEDFPTRYEAAAAYMMVDGAFNVNSTSVEAWTAILSGLAGVDVDLVGGGLSTGNTNPQFFRLRSPTEGLANSATDSSRWNGFRSLTPDQVRNLAERIVDEVKKRGPFISMSDFVNRRLVDRGDPDAETGLKGALQAALDAEFEGSTDQDINRGIFDDEIDTSRVTSYPTSGGVNGFPDVAHWIGTTGTEGPIFGGATGFITQADLLQALAPILTVRSDTFRVRAYGEVVNPLTGDVEAQAWCEAIVQRMPRYVIHDKGEGEGDKPWKTLNAVISSDRLTEPSNIVLGRRFEVLSFRWLDATEV